MIFWGFGWLVVGGWGVGFRVCLDRREHNVGAVDPKEPKCERTLRRQRVLY